ncbi:RrF2 family transcriptional regulator [Sedimenticola sp.]|uniref:RrF2 family transcriptional regulator n=1 Tax=Sedimenticola sp. TaxID=1940285 RepID=UPI00258890EB|nr:Rrf2 family transcriptional regulator [Sedimenticola sp.]MCW8903541.1 Rrf2 family transcriptional regulator [Sedimenticola sp.]
MRLTTFTDYSIRVLIYLALDRERLATAGELATSYDISHNHLTKVVHYLGQHGYIETIRGKGGGIRLALSPDVINIGTLIRQSEQNSVLVECFSPDNCKCKILPACRLASILMEAQEAFFRVLEKYTLSDLIGNASALDDLLSGQA